MEDLVLTVKEREGLGTGASKKLRASGRIPVSYYGPSGNRHLSVDATEFRVFWKQVKHSTSLFDIEDEGGKRVRSLIQDVQMDAITRKPLHIDIREIAKGVEISADVEVHAKGEPYGVKNEGGILEMVADTIAVRCLPRNLPSEIVVDVTELKVNDSIHIRDVEAPEGVTFGGDPDQVLISCVGASKSPEPAEEPEEVEAEEEVTAES